MEALIFLSAPLVMAFILVGIHCYLGIHILSRGIIFVDLSLAQAASFGAVLALSMGLKPSSLFFYLVSLGMTLISAGFLTVSNSYRQYFSQEATIGVLYAFFSALTVLFLEQTAHGAENMKQVLMGQLLWVGWADVFKISCIYGVVSIFYCLFGKPFLSASFHPASYHWKWDLLFYTLFAVVITSSVQVAGVILIFSFLVVPALVTSLFCKKFSSRVFLGWGIGFVLSVLGIYFSYVFDFPTGAFLIVLFTIVPIVLVLSKAIFKSP